MGGLEIRELEAFLAIARELHFGRAGERLHVSQSRVSQLLQSLERRVGAPLVHRTSRRVALTPLGERLLADAGPAYATLRAAVDAARAEARDLGRPLRVGFQGAVDDHLARALALVGEGRAGRGIELAEIPMSDPFGGLRRGELDAAVVLLPVAEDDLEAGPVFSRHPQTLAVASGHPLAARESVGAEDLAGVPLIGIRGPAPAYWRRVQAPRRTPGGLPIPAGPAVDTLQEGLSLAAARRGAMLLCRSTAEQQTGRRALAFVPVRGLPDSALGLVRLRGPALPEVRALARAVSETAAPGALSRG